MENGLLDMLTFTRRWFSFDRLEGRSLLFNRYVALSLFDTNHTVTYLLDCAHAIHWPLVTVGLWATVP